MSVKPFGHATLCLDTLKLFLDKTDKGNPCVGLAFRFTGWDPRGTDHSGKVKIFTIYEELTKYYSLEKDGYYEPSFGDFIPSTGKVQLLENIKFEYNHLLNIAPNSNYEKFCFSYMNRQAVDSLIDKCMQDSSLDLILKGIPYKGITENGSQSLFTSFSFCLQVEPSVAEGTDTGIPCPPIWTGAPEQRPKLVTTHAVVKASNPKSSSKASLKSLSQYMTEETRKFYEKNWDEIIPKLKALYEDPTNNICTV